jgi:hypothetical protein
MGKNEPNFKSPENSDLKFIVVVADYKEDGKISLLLSN